MYQMARRLDPESIYQVSRFAFMELALAGVTAVGEFHYVHHQPDGTPYEDRTVLSDAVIRAARDVGLRVTLLRVLYHRAGFGEPAEGAQRRFSDEALEPALRDVDDLRTRHRDDPMINIGIAPHSIRAVPLDWIKESAEYCARYQMPLHMHVAEQQRELQECLEEHGAPPVRTLANAGVLSPRFVAVHATHLEDDEIHALGSEGALACICRTTERDLGDGLCRASDLVAAGVTLCTGVDSHAISDPFEEARAIELDDRSRTEARHVVGSADLLLEAATRGGYRALGLDDMGDEVVLDGAAPGLAGTGATNDSIVFAGSPAAVKHVKVGGELVVESGVHKDYGVTLESYLSALDVLLES